MAMAGSTVLLSGIVHAGFKEMKPAVLAKTLPVNYKIYIVAIDYTHVKGYRIASNLFTMREELDVLVNAFTVLKFIHQVVRKIIIKF